MFKFEIEEEAADPHIEGGYRRGYHQAIAMVVEALRSNPELTVANLDTWVATKGMHWRNDLPLDKKIIAPPFID